LEDAVRIPYSEIPNFPVPTIPGHNGALVFGTKCGQEVVVLQGRIHYYEGLPQREITLPIRVLAALGVKTVVLTNDEVHTLKSIESAADKLISPLQDLEDHLHVPINYCVIPVFAFANAGIDLSLMNMSDLFSGVGLAVMLGLVLGKFIGVFSFSWLAIKSKIVSLPANTSWKAFASVCMICGIGFTVSMFIADLSYSELGAEGAELLNKAKLGVLSGSVIAAVLGCVLLNFTLPKATDKE
jgi:NhaA family Na+:H+ antiporter